MKRYKLTVETTKLYTIEVDAKNVNDAISMVEETDDLDVYGELQDTLNIEIMDVEQIYRGVE